MIPTKIKIMPVMVSYFSYGWIQQCVECFRKWFPELKILVVDNNPNSPEEIGHWSVAEVYNMWVNQYKFCLAERDWLKSQDDIIFIKNNTGSCRHGDGLDEALGWCKDSEIDVMLAIDPDCVFDGTKWFYDLLEPIITEDAWMTTPLKDKEHADNVSWADGTWEWWYRITVPSMHQVSKMNLSFTEVYNNNVFYDCMAWAYWNSEKTKVIGEIDDFKHYFCGSHLRQVDNNRNSPYVTFM